MQQARVCTHIRDSGFELVLVKDLSGVAPRLTNLFILGKLAIRNVKGFSPSLSEP